MVNTHDKIIPKFLGFFIMLYMAGPLATMLLVYKQVPLFGHIVSAASFLSPIWYITSDIITEVYGFRVVRNLFWCWGPAVLIIAFLLNALIYLPSPPGWHHANAYKIVMGNLFRTVIDAWLVMGISNYINTYLISKWKIRYCGKHFWLRSIAASTIGICLLEVMFEIGIIGTLPFQTLVSMMLLGIAVKMALVIILAFPCQIITTLLKYHEKIDVYDSATSFNPFIVNN